jgi:cytochrome c oxidase subunit 2
MSWGEDSVLAPAGPQAARLAHVYWLFFGTCAAVYVVMVVLLVIALTRGREQALDEKRSLRAVALGGAVTTAVLIALLVGSTHGGHGLNPLLRAHDVLVVRVIARQWWWEFRYQGAAPDQEVTTANELHVPVGQPVLLELISRDVIHSFWVPALHGKRDLIPGHDSTTYIQADRAGLYRGQCAEFCGAQHAKMGFLVIAQTPADFHAWLARQRQPAVSPLPTDEAAARGREVFLRGTCPMCHTISGTPAGATMGPDLTHLGSRLTLGAGSMPNARDHLADWIVDSQNVKPGNRMPPVPIRGRELQDLLAYLETLQ